MNKITSAVIVFIICFMNHIAAASVVVDDKESFVWIDELYELSDMNAGKPAHGNASVGGKLKKALKKTLRAVKEGAKDLGAELKRVHNRVKKELRRYGKRDLHPINGGELEEVTYEWWRDGANVVVRFSATAKVYVAMSGSGLYHTIVKGDLLVIRPGQRLFLLREGEYMRITDFASVTKNEYKKLGLIPVPFADLSSRKESPVYAYGDVENLEFEYVDDLPVRAYLGGKKENPIEIDTMIQAYNYPLGDAKFWIDAGWCPIGAFKDKSVWFMVRGRKIIKQGDRVPAQVANGYEVTFAPFIYPSWGNEEQFFNRLRVGGEVIIGDNNYDGENILFTLVTIKKVE